ncbi:hypothetical protein ZIOFF_000724 [Zingiber officinale]|uniref:Uncharacterized protein n=1 Tax=Zingiber officinale TaxID=94328 RepID=A0A8J5I0S9_ZINOF|nr:hypothetical protein ZIOFF_000724 [Zingiber officinale]
MIAQRAWEILQTNDSSQDQVKKVRLSSLRANFEKLEMKDNKKVLEYFTRTSSIVNQMESNGEIMKTQRVVEKILRNLSGKFDHVVIAIEESQDLSLMSLESLQERLEAHENVGTNGNSIPYSDNSPVSSLCPTYFPLLDVGSGWRLSGSPDATGSFVDHKNAAIDLVNRVLDVDGLDGRSRLPERGCRLGRLPAHGLLLVDYHLGGHHLFATTGSLAMAGSMAGR